MPGGTSPSPDPSSRRQSATPSSSASAGDNKSRDASKSSTAPANGVARQRTLKSSTGSPMSARSAAAKRSSVAGKENVRSQDEEVQRAETGALIEDLNAQLRKAEQASEDYQKELVVLQSRLDEAVAEQAKLEELAHGHAERVEKLETDNKETLKRHKDLESKYESDLAASMKDKEEAAAREDELNLVIQKLKDSLAQKESRRGSEGGGGLLQRAASFRGRSSPKPEGSASPSRDRSQDNANLLTQKDKIIEGLRLELAEAQIKVMEIENAGGNRLQDLEKALLETKMANAKLMEESESYQVLLQEKTLTGDLTRAPIFQAPAGSHEPTSPHQSGAGNRSSLAEELENAKEEGTEAEIDPNIVRRLEAELNATKDQNKALTLYINKIITRLLQSDQFEKLFTDGSLGDDPTPPEPPPKDTRPNTSDSQEAAPSLLQRAGSLFGGRRPRPRSFQNPTAGAEGHVAPVPEAGAPPSDQAPSIVDPAGLLKPVNEDPSLAPSLPIRRSGSSRGGAGKYTHRRVRSEVPASITNDIYKGPPAAAPSQITSPPDISSPPLSQSYFPPTGSSPEQGPQVEATRRASGPADVQEGMMEPPAQMTRQGSDSGYGDSQAPSETTEMPSPPRSVAGSSTDGRSGAGANRTVFDGSSGRTMRPLRLVQEKQEAEEAERKKANRGSFMGWFSARAPTVLSGQPVPPQSSSSNTERPATGGSQEST